MDFIDQIFEYLPLPAAIVVMFVTFMISRMVVRDEKGRLPDWFLLVPFTIGMALGIPAYLMGRIGATISQPVWVTAFSAAFQGLLYGAVAIGLWSARRIIPYFKRIESNGSLEEPPTPSQGGTP